MRQRGGSLKGVTRIVDRENEYQRQHRKYLLSPEVDLLDCIIILQRNDPFQEDGEGRTYKEIMKNKYLDEEEEKVYKQIAEKQKEEDEFQRKVIILFPSSFNRVRNVLMIV